MSKSFFLFLLLSTLLPALQASDPDPLSDFSDNVNDEETDQGKSPFTFRQLLKNGEVSNGPGGIRAGLTTKLYPAIESQGITYVHFVLKPCGVNPPHTHPRATELLTLVSGGPMQVGFIDTAGKAHIDILRPGDVTIFPRALMHFELNVGTTPAFFVSALNSENPGTLTAGTGLFNLPERTVATALNIDLEYARHIKAKLPEYGPQLELASRDVCVPGKDITTDF